MSSSSCSYCGVAGHNIRACNSPLVNILYRNMHRIYMEISSRITTRDTVQALAVNVLCNRFALRDLKLIIANYTRLSVSVMRKHTLALEICNHFETLGEPQNANANWVTVVHEEQQQPEIITWGIDRVPGPLEPGDDDQRYYVLLPRVLEQDFEMAAINKYYISPVLMVQESDEELDKNLECPICYEDIKLLDSVTLNCGHLFCYTCIKSTMQSHPNLRRSPSCAMCRETMTTFVVKNEELLEAVSHHCIN